jgi:hypothetical protein
LRFFGGFDRHCLPGEECLFALVRLFLLGKNGARFADGGFRHFDFCFGIEHSGFGFGNTGFLFSAA